MECIYFLQIEAYLVDPIKDKYLKVENGLIKVGKTGNTAKVRCR
jgi:hypothetical protein